MPALQPCQTLLADATGFAPVFMGTQLGSVFCNSWSGNTVSRSPGAPDRRASDHAQLTSRVASAAECMKIPVLGRLVLGFWVDTVDFNNSRVPSSVPVRYTDESVKFASQQRVKHSAVHAIRAAVAEHA